MLNSQTQYTRDDDVVFLKRFTRSKYIGTLGIEIGHNADRLAKDERLKFDCQFTVSKASRGMKKWKVGGRLFLNS
jgi:hypothetical protein